MPSSNADSVKDIPVTSPSAYAYWSGQDAVIPDASPHYVALSFNDW